MAKPEREGTDPTTAAARPNRSLSRRRMIGVGAAATVVLVGGVTTGVILSRGSGSPTIVCEAGPNNSIECTGNPQHDQTNIGLRSSDFSQGVLRAAGVTVNWRNPGGPDHYSDLIPTKEIGPDTQFGVGIKDTDVEFQVDEVRCVASSMTRHLSPLAVEFSPTFGWEGPDQPGVVLATWSSSAQVTPPTCP